MVTSGTVPQVISSGARKAAGGGLTESRMRATQAGFTLLEIMIVIAIIAIMLVIAVPVYQDYSVRAKVAECVALQAPIKLKISEAAIDEKRMPPMADVAVNRTTAYCDRGSYVRDGDDAATLIVNVNES